MCAFARRLAALALIAGSLMVTMTVLPSPAHARTVVAVGIGVPAYGYYGPPPYPYGPPPYYYAQPAPVYVAPPVTYVVPAPAPAAPGPAPTGTWYYCDNPQGYYPYVPNCNSAWRPVQQTPGQ
jgi:hypothetical protein